MILLYNILLSICLLIALPFLFIFMPKRELKMRLGLHEEGNTGYIWFHCASVGEVNALKPLLKVMKEKYPHDRILVTTMTLTGLETAKTVKEVDEATLLPFDLILLYKLLLKRYQPRLLIIVETELWISLFHACRSAKIPVLIVNGRISDSSYGKYHFLSHFVKKTFSYVSFVGAQSEEDKKRFISLGFNNVHNTQNLKFCTRLPDIDVDKTKAEWGVSKEDFVIVWGSSREGEEELILSYFRRLQRQIPNLLLIIAPRHLNRLPQIKEMSKKRRYSLLSKQKKQAKESDIIIIDSMGELVHAYAVADIAIVGGSFFDHGGHNPLEPLYYKTPTIIGSFHSSCRNLVEMLVANEAIIISSRKKLVDDIIKLADDEKLRKRYGDNGKKAIDNNSCSVEQNMQFIKKYLSS